MGIQLGFLVQSFGGELIGSPDLCVEGIAPLQEARAEHITFLSNPKYRRHVENTGAAAVILSPLHYAELDGRYQGACILTDNPYAYFAKVAQLFAKEKEPAWEPGVCESAVIAKTAKIAATVKIGANVTIEEGAVIEEGVRIDAGCFIGHGVKIGRDTHLFANVTFYHGCEIGERGLVHSGAVIGADGFGFANEGGIWVKIPQTGRVVIGNDVEIGANTCIDRGALVDTVIEEGVKLDNQIQLGHNCHIGAHTIIAACVAVAGSAKIGRHCIIGGGARITGHIVLCDHVVVSPTTFIIRSVLEPGTYTGIYPFSSHAEWEKSAAIVRNMVSLRDKIRSFEKMIKTFLNK
jgi:UDP-3-O-[3-hydroxymyristoyl] glucosamine N-acyltransferase